MYKYILIDLDGTLLDFSKGEKQAFIETLKNVGYNCSIELYNYFSEINEYYFNEYSKNNMTRDEFHYKRFLDIINKIKIDIDPMKLDKYYVESLKYQAQLFDDINDTLSYLSNKYKLYIASNGMLEIQNKRLEIAKLDKYFSKCYVSEKIGYNKPDINFFKYIIDDIKDYNTKNYLMIGDRYDTDIVGALNSGIDAILIDRNNKNKNDYKEVVYKFYELKNIL